MNTKTQDRPQSRDLAHHSGPASPPAQAGPPSESAQVLAMVIEAAKNPEIDAAKMEQMVGLTTKLQDREREAEFNRALNAAIMEMPVVTRAGEIIIPANQQRGTPARKQGKFARFEDIDRVCRPILARYNLTIRFDVGTAEQGAITIRPIISHANGHTERGEAMRLPADTSGSKNATQAVGSAVQYGRRYAYCAALNIVTEGVDDDGNLGQTPVSLPYEREQTVLNEAREAHEQGRYQAWFDRQSAKDRGFLVSNNYHAEFGGVALPSPTPPPSPEPPPARDQQPPDQGTSGQGRKKAQTPREWVDSFNAIVDGHSDLDKLDEFWDGKREALEQLRAREPTLWQEAHNHISAKHEALSEGRLV